MKINIGTKLRFRKGDIIFGRRRAYQRKLAVAEFDGICSAHAMVVRPKHDLVLPQFLPFLMISDAFMKRAVEISVGSLSPTINWTALSLEEFYLPPLNQQRRIAEILWAIDEDEQNKADLASHANGLLIAALEEELDRLFEGPCESLTKILSGSPESGCSAPASSTETGHFVLSLSALSRNGYVPGNLKPIPATKAMLDRRLADGDFLVSRSNTQELVGFVGIFNENRNDVSFPDTMMRLPVNETRVTKRYLEAVLLSRRGRLHMMRSAAGTSASMKKINRQTLGTCLIPTPTLKEQERLLRKVERLREAVASTNASKIASNAVKVVLVETLLGGG